MPRVIRRIGVSLVRIFVSVASIPCDCILQLLVNVSNMISRVFHDNQHVCAPRKAGSGHPQSLGPLNRTGLRCSGTLIRLSPRFHSVFSCFCLKGSHLVQTTFTKRACTSHRCCNPSPTLPVIVVAHLFDFFGRSDFRFQKKKKE